MYIKLQNLILQDDNNWQKESMFCLHKAENVVSYATYFNSLSIEKWKKYTDIRNIRLCILYVGRCKLKLINYRIDKENKIDSSFIIDDRCINTELYDQVLDTDDSSWSVIEIPDYVIEGIVGFEIYDVSPTFQLIEGYYEGDISEESIHEVKLALNICTCNREKEITNTLKVLSAKILNDQYDKNPQNHKKSQYEDLSDNLEVYIQDNGQTLDIDSIESDKIHIVYNKNCGGSGGFTRGLIEIMHRMNAFPATHVIMMDDDIEIHPETLFRTYSILKCRKSEYADITIGGAMFDLDHPLVQIESGALWKSGRTVHNKFSVEMSSTAACVINELEEPADYNAWWYYCMPISFIRPDNLPMPMFIGGDDIEYGLRNMGQLFLLNGICVWHEPSENKYSTSRVYYSHRNMLMINSLHCDGYGYLSFAKALLERVVKQLAMLRYNSADLLIRASEDYLKGIDYIKTQDAVELNSEIANMGYSFAPIEDIFIYDNSCYRQPAPKLKGLWNKLVYALTLSGTFLPAKNRSKTGALMLHPMESSAFDVYREEKIFYYDDKYKRGFMVQRDRARAVNILVKTIGVIFKASINYKKAKYDFKTRVGEVTSETFWREYLGIE